MANIFFFIGYGWIQIEDLMNDRQKSKLLYYGIPPGDAKTTLSKFLGPRYSKIGPIGGVK